MNGTRVAASIPITLSRKVVLPWPATGWSGGGLTDQEIGN